MPFETVLQTQCFITPKYFKVHSLHIKDILPFDHRTAITLKELTSIHRYHTIHRFKFYWNKWGPWVALGCLLSLLAFNQKYSSNFLKLLWPCHYRRLQDSYFVGRSSVWVSLISSWLDLCTGVSLGILQKLWWVHLIAP